MPSTGQCSWSHGLEDVSAVKRSDSLLHQGFSMLRGTAIPFMLVGDEACSRLPWIMKGHTGRPSREGESMSTWAEHAMLHSKHSAGSEFCWHILLKHADIYNKFMQTVVAATCLLYNFFDKLQKKANQCTFHHLQADLISGWDQRSGTFWKTTLLIIFCCAEAHCSNLCSENCLCNKI